MTSLGAEISFHRPNMTPPIKDRQSALKKFFFFFFLLNRKDKRNKKSETHISRLYYCLLWSSAWHSLMTLHPTVSLGVRRIVIRRSQTLSSTIKKNHQSAAKLSWLAWHGGRLFWKCITENDSCLFPNLLEKFPHATSSLIRKLTSVEETVGGWLLLIDESVNTEMKTSMQRLLSWHAKRYTEENKRTPQTTCMQTYVINKKENDKEVTHLLCHNSTHTHKRALFMNAAHIQSL